MRKEKEKPCGKGKFHSENNKERRIDWKRL